MINPLAYLISPAVFDEQVLQSGPFRLYAHDIASGPAIPGRLFRADFAFTQALGSYEDLAEAYAKAKRVLPVPYRYEDYMETLIRRTKRLSPEVNYLLVSTRTAELARETIKRAGGKITNELGTPYHKGVRRLVLRYTYTNRPGLTGTALSLFHVKELTLTRWAAIAVERQRLGPLATVVDLSADDGLTARAAFVLSVRYWGVGLDRARLAKLLLWYHGRKGLKFQRLNLVRQ